MPILVVNVWLLIVSSPLSIVSESVFCIPANVNTCHIRSTLRLLFYLISIDTSGVLVTDTRSPCFAEVFGALRVSRSPNFQRGRDVLRVLYGADGEHRWLVVSQS